SVRLSPSWLAAGINSAEVYVDYPSSGAGVHYHYQLAGNRLSFSSEGSFEKCSISLPLPANKKAGSVIFNGKSLTVGGYHTNGSSIEFEADVKSGKVDIELVLEQI
ncbi:MAG: hypothetical protein U0X39_15985, partial [Bacteroidales bacterium]